MELNDSIIIMHKTCFLIKQHDILTIFSPRILQYSLKMIII